MQTVNKYGILGAVEDYNLENMKRALDDPDTDHIQIFKGTPATMMRRAALQGQSYKELEKEALKSKKINLRPGKGFRKTGNNKKKR